MQRKCRAGLPCEGCTADRPIVRYPCLADPVANAPLPLPPPPRPPARRLYDHRGIPLPAVRRLARQLLVALHHLHSRCHVIHTDLKPENVMLTQPVKPRRPLADGQPAAGPEGIVAGRPQQHAGGGGGGRPSKLQAAVAAGQALTKNQKKKLRQRQKNKGAAAAGAGAEGGSEADGNGSASVSMATATADGGSGEEGGGEEACSSPPAQQRAEPAEVAVEEEQQLEQGGAPRREGEQRQRHEGGKGEGPSGGGGGERVDLEELSQRLLTMDCKIVDFGNACWTHKHFTDDIQTRQYRSPEVPYRRRRYTACTTLPMLLCRLATHCCIATRSAAHACAALALAFAPRFMWPPGIWTAAAPLECAALVMRGPDRPTHLGGRLCDVPRVRQAPGPVAFP